MFYLHQLMRQPSDNSYLLRRSGSENLTLAGLGFRFGFRSLLGFFSTFVLVSHG